MTISQTAVVQALNDYCFEKIWNSPQFEYVENIQLTPVSSRFSINWIILNKYIPLPQNNTLYAVYRASYDLFEGSLIIPYNTWVSTTNVATTYQTLFDVYTASGLMVPKGSVSLYIDAPTRKVYIAITQGAVMNSMGLSDWSSMYISVYRYLQTGNPLTCQSFIIPNPDAQLTVTSQVNQAIATSLATTTDGTTVYVNGYAVFTTAPITLAPGDYVDVITDTTVVGMFDVTITTTDTGYFSTQYNTYKNVLHCPKSLNPTNKIITPELLSLVARRSSDNVGLYVTKSAVNSITQITHQDFGINTEVVDAMRTALNSQDIYIEVKIRTHTNTLIREINYIDYLYINSDDTILNFLRGNGQSNLSFWSAASLEASAYVGYMAATPAFVTAQTLSNYISGLGYYTVVSVLCQHINNFPINRLPMSNLSVPKPLVLSSLPAYPIVYLNGTKLRDAQVGYSNTSQDNLLIGVTSDVYYTTGQTFTVDVIEAGSNTPSIVTPAAGATTTTVPFADIQIFQLNRLTTPVTAYEASSSLSCTPVVLQSTGPIQTYASATAGSTDIVFAPSTFGNTYIIQNKSFSRCFGFDVSSLVTAVAPIHVELTALCSDAATIIPFVGYNSIDVYLNGQHLTPKIDYSATPLTDSNGNVALIQVMICNMQAVSLTQPNYVEVIARTGEVIASETNYITNNIANVNNVVDFWYSGTSMLFANGSYQINPTDIADALQPNPPVGNGAPFQVITELPDAITTVLAGYTTTADDQRISLINAYLNLQAPVNDTSTVVVANSWKLYSPYLTAIYSDVLANGTVSLFSNDPSDATFLLQFAQYDYLKANDPTVNSAISDIDLRYCDVNPCYTTVTVPDTNSYAILRRLATLVLVSDSNTLGDVYNA